jgi:hypothetical protein
MRGLLWQCVGFHFTLLIKKNKEMSVINQKCTVYTAGTLEKKEGKISRTRLYCAVLFGLTAFAPVFAEENIFAPFVSRIAAEVADGFVRIGWVDSPSVKGPVTVYSSDNPVNPALARDEPASSVRAAEVSYGTQFYIDKTDNTRKRHYFVVASDESGFKYYLSIPYRNFLSVEMPAQNPVLPIEEIPPPIPPASPFSSTAMGTLEAAVQDEQVVIDYKNSNEGKENFILYRSVYPLREEFDLLDAVAVQSGMQFPFIDYPAPGIPYYYAVVTQSALVSGRAEFVAGRNATEKPVMLPLANSGNNGADILSLRPMPLPLLSPLNLIPESIISTLIDPAPISESAERALADIEEEREKSPKILLIQKTFIFQDDMQAPGNGEEYAFRSIVQGVFAKGDWRDAKEQFRAFLVLPRSAETEAKARFYLGQVFYFLALPQEALLEFLLVKDRFSDETHPWIEACLSALVAGKF